ncbi:hypothetical protein SAMN05444487_102155 [Marininema mesophilum]|uniref:DUF4878 domain-containing protein n=1 Tax=Marininema mesophilum TaxID=1048340 RepID=A0A1H2SBV4_9BACL|nr:hypothetical protein [Marininema mesophilum]SDW28614.1 hypothetical protein SAMN05444487_102155 [Marininema mesophilum]
MSMRTKHLATMALLISLILPTACSTEDTSTAEQTAVRFYKEVWVNGNDKAAKSMLAEPKKTQELHKPMQQVKNEATQNPAIWVVKSPTDHQMGTRTILIYRPSDKRDYKVRLYKTQGTWKVISFQQNFDPKEGGYASFEAYQRLSSEYPDLKWKKIDNP